MRVDEEPAGGSPREVLDALLAPHALAARPALGGRLVIVAAPPPAVRGRVVAADDGRPLGGVTVRVVGRRARSVGTDAAGGFRLDGLAAGRYTVEARMPGFVIGRWPEVEVAAGHDTVLTLELVPAPTSSDEIVVTAGDGQTPPSGFARRTLTAERAAALPHLGDDALRAASLLPGAASTEASAQVSVRGGRDDEVLMLLDGLELRSPYHLQEFDSALSIVAPASLERVDLVTDGYPAEYGGRMGGVLDMTTRPPADTFHFAAGVGTFFGQLSGSGRFAGDRGSWFGVARGGTYRLALEIADRPADPRYGDLFAKAGYRLAPGHELSFDLLVAEDDFDHRVAGADPAEELVAYANRSASRYVWATHTGLLRPDLYAETVASFGRLERGRTGTERGPDGGFRLHDDRVVEIAGLKQGWTLQLGDRMAVKWGLDARREEAVLDYTNQRSLLEPLAAVRTADAVGSTAFAGQIDGNEVAGYLSLPLQLGPGLGLEIGLRYDHPAITGEHLVSPRFSLGWAATDRDLVRAAWGWYYQSQRPDELQIEDGETGLARAERSEHRTIGFEHRFDGGARLGAELYDRRISHPRKRFENLFDPVLLSPELSPDRVLIAPDRGRARGFELTWRGVERRRVSWWAAYTLASIDDLVDGRWQPRSVDQTHALRSELAYRFHRGWELGLVWSYHTGWPTTAVTGAVVPGPDGEPGVEPVLGPLYAERLPDYHRLDLRLRRDWKVGSGKLSAYLDLQNLYDRDNLRGFDDFELDLGPEGAPRVRSSPETWGGFLPSFGVRWEL
jgi:hypothetical protein